MNFKKYILFFVLSCSFNFAYGQDFHLSQYDAAALNVNPALTGLFRGRLRIHGHYRNQWLKVADKPFTTAVAALDVNKGKWGIGGQIANFRAGQGGYNQISILPSLAYHKPLGKKKNSMLSVGAQIGAFQKTVNASSLTFASQYVESNGGDFNTSLPSGENFESNAIYNLDINLGVMYHYTNRYSRLNPFVGLTAYHLNNPKETFLGEVNRLPLRFQFQAGSRISLTKRISLTPKVFIQYQKSVEEITAGILGHYHLKNPNFFLLYGGTYRSEKDAVIAEVGAKYGAFEGRFSYDINLSTLKGISNGRGASEFSLTYIFNRPKVYPLEKCPKIP